MLSVAHLQAGYGPAQVLFDVSFAVGAGEVVTLIGRNGMGKTTTILTIMGLLPPTGGTVRFEDIALTGLPPYRIAQAGLGFVPEGRQVFPTLTVEENLVATAAVRFGQRWTLARVYEFFPKLAERRRHYGHQLSGGEQQMLAIGRALMAEPRLLLVDELSLGLMPKMVDLCLQTLLNLKREGVGILLVEQNTARALDVADQVIVLSSGAVVFRGTAAQAKAQHSLFAAFLGMPDQMAT